MAPWASIGQCYKVREHHSDIVSWLAMGQSRILIPAGIHKYLNNSNKLFYNNVEMAAVSLEWIKIKIKDNG